MTRGCCNCFPGTHPKIIQEWLPHAEGIFRADRGHQPDVARKKTPADAEARKDYSGRASTKNITGWCVEGLVAGRADGGDGNFRNVRGFCPGRPPSRVGQTDAAGRSPSRASASPTRRPKATARCSAPVSPPTVSVESFIRPPVTSSGTPAETAKPAAGSRVSRSAGPPPKMTCPPCACQRRASSRKFPSGQFFCGELVSGLKKQGSSIRVEPVGGKKFTRGRQRIGGQHKIILGRADDESALAQQFEVSVGGVDILGPFHALRVCPALSRIVNTAPAPPRAGEPRDSSRSPRCPEKSMARSNFPARNWRSSPRNSGATRNGLPLRNAARSSAMTSSTSRKPRSSEMFFLRGEEGDFCIREILADGRDRRQGQQHVADGLEPDQQDVFANGSCLWPGGYFSQPLPPSLPRGFLHIAGKPPVRPAAPQHIPAAVEKTAPQ